MATDYFKHQAKYDVFVSFRGVDTRDTFLSHLYVALDKQGIRVFKDTELERGEEISSAILRAIEDSTIALIIFSQNYASSSWCLDELVKIMECRGSYKQRVVPVFYRVDPEDVCNQTASYGEAMANHEAQFKDQRKVQTWREALRNASYISGWDSKIIMPDAALVEEIAKDIANKLKQEVPDCQRYGICVNCSSNNISSTSKATRNQRTRSEIQSSTSNSLLKTTLTLSLQQPEESSMNEPILRCAMDERIRRRMMNREYARRSRLRKQIVLEGLVKEVSKLYNSKNQLIQSINVTSQQYNEIESANCILRAQAVELEERLQFLNSDLHWFYLRVLETHDSQQIPCQALLGSQ